MDQKEFTLKKKLAELKHKFAMEEIETKKKVETDIENLKHSNLLEAQRIKSAEIKKTLERKRDRDFMESYSKK